MTTSVPPLHASQPSGLRLLDALDRVLLLRAREAAARAMPADRRAVARKLHRAAEELVDAAMGHHGVPALALARSAVPIFLEAALAARGTDAITSGVSPDDLWQRYDDLAVDGAVPPLPEDLAPARLHALAPQGLDDEIREHGEPRVDEALRLAMFVADAVEVRTAMAIQVERVFRVAALMVIIATTVFVVRSLLPTPPNRALHANVTMSSRRTSSGPPLDLTNGKVVPETGIATNDEPDPWVEVDLGAPFRVSEVTLMNSDDHQDDLTPLRVETSLDEKSWDAAGVQKSSFSAAEPAVVSFRGRSARYVKIHGRPGGAIYLHEVEIR